MKISCSLFNIGYDFVSKRTKFEFFADGDITSSLEPYIDKKLALELKKDNPRSKNSNGLLWVMLGQLQDKLKIPKEELYRHYVYGCGVYEVLPVRNDAVDRFIESWGQRGLGWVCDTTKSKLEGYTNVLAYYGTSVYTKEEMWTLLNQVVDDCKEQGIPVEEKESIKSLLKEEFK